MLKETYIDVMTDSQDVAQSPLSSAEKDRRCNAIKGLGAIGVAVSTPYNVPSGYPDAMNQTHEWIVSAAKYGLKVWLRQSWADDEGWYGVPKQITNDRITDTANWIKAYNAKYPSDLNNVTHFTAKPEPQNMGINGVNSSSNYRFASPAVFNKWLRDMMYACKTAFTGIGFAGVDFTKWGFDGFITCGYDNPDWQGKSFLESATVTAMGNEIAVDHYPAAKPYSDFVAVFKQTWPNIKYSVSEYGGDAAELKTVLDTVKDDPMFAGFFNYWNLDGGADVALLTNGVPNQTGTTLQSYYNGATTPPSNTDLGIVLSAINGLDADIKAKIDQDKLLLGQIKVIVWGTDTTSTKVSKLKTLLPR